jgi:aspartyl-tRNA(Asn)/glutamyl-tRNA(Gln) amidotransferase subunit A
VTELTRLAITDASDLLRRREITAVELTEATVERIEATEPVVHAYVLVLADRARRSAYQVDRELAQGRWRPHDVPIAVRTSAMRIT